MTLAETPSTTVQRVHPGGFFWGLERAERERHLMSFAAQTQKLAVICNTVREAEQCAERLTLSGVPVHLASNLDNPTALRAFVGEDASTLVTTHEYMLSHGPTPATMTVHLRTALSVRDYTKRLDALPAAVHLSFVVPEDRRRAESLISHFGNDHGHGAPNNVELGEVIDLTVTNEIAMVSHARRRFPLGRS